MQRSLLLVLALLGASFAGCIGSDGDGNVSTDAPVQTPRMTDVLADLLATGESHDHSSPGQHGAALNTSLLDHLALAEEGQQSGVHALAIRGDLLFAASTLGPNPGFAILDVSDPSDMQIVGEYRDPTAVGGDRSISVSEDGSWVFLANEGDVTAEEAGVRAIDVSDPANPSEAAFFPMHGGAHTVETITIDGTLYVFALNYGVQTLRLVESPAGPELVKVGQYTYAGPEMTDAPSYENPGDYPTWGLRAVYAHDMRAVHDPEVGPLLYIAYAYQGLKVLDIGNPEAPQMVASWVPGGEDAPWYTHTVEVSWIDDRRIVVVGSEVFEDRHTDTPSPIWILDMTDLSNPEHLSTWTNPMDVGSDHLLFSAHFFRIEDGYVHLSHYHGGVWVLDITTPERQAAPTVVGAYLPNEDTGFQPDAGECCLGWNLAGVPVTMDAVAKDGITFAGDLQTGVYAIETDGLSS